MPHEAMYNLWLGNHYRLVSQFQMFIKISLHLICQPQTRHRKTIPQTMHRLVREKSRLEQNSLLYYVFLGK